VTVIDIGSSYEGRPLRVVKVSNGAGKNGIFFDSVLHAREWIGPPTLLFAINELTENLANNQALLDANDWYFLLVANPDGFVYSWIDDRLWRKTRSPNINDPFCAGTDLNRNFYQHWGGETAWYRRKYSSNKNTIVLISYIKHNLAVNVFIHYEMQCFFLLKMSLKKVNISIRTMLLIYQD
jgi:Zinc carboxypeptidase